MSPFHTFLCGTRRRRALLGAQEGGPGERVDGIDALLVIDDHEDPDGHELRQRVLFVRLLFGDGIASLSRDDVRIEGGVRVRNPRVSWVGVMAGLDPSTMVPAISPASQTWLSGIVAATPAALTERTLVVLVEVPGDFSPYRLRIEGDATAIRLDPRSNTVEFSFKVECPSPFDCAPEDECPPVDELRPELDYLARDFESFRRLMLSRLAVLQAHERVSSPVTLRTTLVEVLAYAADREAYHQDAVATEAYLGTARLRRSVRRHARLLGYRMSEGCNARAFVHLGLADGARFDAGALQAGATFLTRVPERGLIVPQHVLGELPREVEGFAAMHDAPALSHAHNEISLHTWGDEECCLVAGATFTDLVDQRDGDAAPLELAVGDLLLFEQVRSPRTHAEADADPAVRWVVRLTAIDDPVIDPLDPVHPGARVRRVHWHADDAPTRDVPVVGDADTYLVARGNIVLVDHGLPVQDAPVLETFGAREPSTVQARLSFGPLTFAAPLTAEAASARALMEPALHTARPQVQLHGEGEPWTWVQDLLNSGPGEPHIVVEVDDTQRAWLRFGDSVLGRRPTDASIDQSANGVGAPPFLATYRVGNGSAGNVGTETIRHLVSNPQTVRAPLLASVTRVRNPQPARGGTEPERVDDVRVAAPQAFRSQERAVTPADWSEVATRHPRVSRAAARFRWTGSWTTVFVYVDLLGGEPLSDELRGELHDFLDRYRMAGMDLEIRGPKYVPLDIALSVCLEPGFHPEQVERQLIRRFGSGRLRDGTLGFFHPDRFTFGQSVYLSAILAAATEIRGVRWLDATPPPAPTALGHRFKRLWAPDDGSLANGRISIGELEIARCDSDPNMPEHGWIRFLMRRPMQASA